MFEKVGVFSPDSRNMGGRKQIIALLTNHQNSLEKSRSQLQIKQNQSPLIRRTPSPQYKLYEQFNNVLHTFKRISVIKNHQYCIQESKKNPSTKNNRSTNELMDHLKNVVKSQRRIDALGSLEQRRKNKQDYLVYPAFFFRRLDKNRLKSIINQSGPFPENSAIKTKNTNKSNEAILKEDPDPHNEKWIQFKSKALSQKNTLIQLLGGVKMNKPNKNFSNNQGFSLDNYNKSVSQINWKKIAKTMPKYDVDQKEQFKLQVRSLLIENRIYQDDDYAFIVCMLSSVNMHVEQNEILQLFNEIISQLEN